MSKSQGASEKSEVKSSKKSAKLETYSRGSQKLFYRTLKQREKEKSNCEFINSKKKKSSKNGKDILQPCN